MSQNRPDPRLYLAVLARRWTVILPALVLVPLVALLLAARQHKIYSATADVLLTYSSPGASLNGLASPYPGTSPDRNVATQAALARSPGVAQQALALAHVGSSANHLLAESSVSSPNGSDLLDFSVSDSTPALAVTLATNYARAYTAYRTQIDTQAITSALAGINRQLAQLARSRQTASTTGRTLSHDQQALLAAQASGTNDAVLVQPAQSAVGVGPHPARIAAAGLGVGIILAVALAFLMETLDQRAGTDEIERRLKIPQLASIPTTRRWRRDVKALITVDEPKPRGRDSLIVLNDPNGREAKAFRVLKSNLEVARLEHDFKSLLFTSAFDFDNQAETVANLAMTLAQAGQRVLLCDLGAGHPGIGDVFRLHGRPGVTELVLGRSSLEDAVVPISDPSLASPTPPMNGREPVSAEESQHARLPSADLRGSLGVLPFGAPAPHSGFLGGRAVTELMDQLNRSPYDLVLIDAPPLLDSGEAQTLSTLADAMIVAVATPMRLGILEELSATLSKLPVLALGFVKVGAGRTIGAGRTTVRNRSSAGGAVSTSPDRAVAPPTPITTRRQRHLITTGTQRHLVAPPRVEGRREPPRFSEKLGES
jgi:polysaccharide biosynthesis transport protein